MIGKASLGFLGAVGVMVGAMVPSAARAETPYGATGGVARAESQPAVAVSDENITADIRARMLENVMLRSAQVTIASTNGVVTLVGMVSSQTAKEQAVQTARATPGVVRVDDMLRLDISSPQAPTRN
jgi:hyperosmotically inducible protein